MESASDDLQDRWTGPKSNLWDRILMIVLLVIVAVMILSLSAASVYTVEPYEKAVVLQFGKYRKTVPPGLHFCIPLVEKVLKVSITEHTLRLPAGYASARQGGGREHETLMVTGDLNMVAVEWTIQWKVTDPKKFLFCFYGEDDPKYPEKVIMTVARTVMNRLVGDYSIDEVLTEKRGELAEKAHEATQKMLDEYDCGVRISFLQIQRVRPPEKVCPAFDRINASIQLRARLENEAHKEKDRLLSQARAERDRMIGEAEGYAQRRLAEADGEIEALRAMAREYAKAPEATRQRLYVEAVKTIFSAEVHQRQAPPEQGDKP